MKKLFTLIAASMMCFGAYAADLISASFNPWTSACVVDGNTITFSGQWAGCGAWVATTDENEVTTGLDLSKYDYVWVELAEPAQGNTKFCLQVTSACTSSSDYLIPDGGQIAGIDLANDNVLDKEEFAQTFQIVLQCMENSGNGKVVVKGIYGGTTAEFESAKAGNKQTSTNLSLDNLASGWDSEYDATTHTISLTGADWSGRGWWLGGVDYSDFDQVLIQFDPATATGGKLVVEYNAGDPTEVEFAEGTSNVIADLNDAAKNSVKQIYIMGPAGATFTLSNAIVGTEEVVIAAGVESIVAPKTMNNSAFYNLAGQKVSKDYKGVVIQNGKKFINK